MQISKSNSITFMLVIALFFCANLVLAQNTPPSGGTLPKVVQEDDETRAMLKKASLITGFRFIEDIKNQYAKIGIQMDLDEIMKGIELARSGGKLEMSDAELQALQVAFNKYVQAKSQTAFKLAADKNAREGEAFLKGNSTAEGVKVLESGLQYKVLSENKANPVPKATDRVKVHYTGKFTDGSTFESSREAGRPAEFPVGGVVPGMSEALQRMHVGDKWIIYIPSKLAYGVRGTQGAIGPNQVLIFELELLEIMK